MSYFYWIAGLSFAVRLASVLEIYGSRGEE